MEYESSRILSEINNSGFNLLLVPDTSEFSYRTVQNIYNIVPLVRRGFTAHIVDMDKSSAHLITPSRSLPLADIEKIDFSDPNKLFVVVISQQKNKDNYYKIRRVLGLQETWDEADSEAYNLRNDILDNTINRHPSLTGRRFRYRGTGALIYPIFSIDNVFDLGTVFSHIDEIAELDFKGLMIKGQANTEQFNVISANSAISTLPRVTSYPLNLADVSVGQKQLNICYSSSMIRFMAIENVMYFIKMEDPELFKELKFFNLADEKVADIKNHIENSFITVALDMAQEFPLLVPEAMTAGNIILGFSGTFDNQSQLNTELCDFSTEGDYRPIAKKIIHYARIYKEELAKDPNYVHPLAQAAANFGAKHFNEKAYIDSFIKIFNKVGVNIHEQ